VSHGVDAQLVRYNIVRTPTFKLRIGEALPDYEERLFADMQSRPDFYFLREGIFPSAKHDAVWQAELWAWHQRRLRLRREGTMKNTSACRSNFGKCGFLQPCIDPDREDLLDVYQQRGARHSELVE
jgi:hypothetical protein